MPATYSWKNSLAKIAIAEPFTRSGRRRMPVYAVIRTGRFMESAWRTYPVSGATHSHRKSQRHSFPTGSSVSPVIGSHQGPHFQTECPWRALTAMNAINLMHASNRQMMTVSVVTPVKCWQPRQCIPHPNIARHAISLIAGLHRADKSTWHRYYFFFCFFGPFFENRALGWTL
jgi:hypothetical protein